MNFQKSQLKYVVGITESQFDKTFTGNADGTKT